MAEIGSGSRAATVPNRSRWPLIAAFFASGAAALGFELLWVRLLGFLLGAETFGVLAVLSGFFLGLALGSAGFHNRLLRAKRPILVYVSAELVIAGYGLLSPWLFVTVLEPLPRAVAALVGDNQSALALTLNMVTAALALLPATVPMGVTTAALVEAWRRSDGAADGGRPVGPLYAANTAGATFGIVVSTYWLLPRFGTQIGATVLAGTCLAAAAIALTWGKSGGVPVDEASRVQPSEYPPVPKGIVIALMITGFAGVGFEAVVTQILAQMLENTVYTFANILAVYLIGTSLGAWLYTRPAMSRFFVDHERGTLRLVYALAISVLVAGPVLALSPDLLAWLVPAGASYQRYLFGEVAVAVAVLLPATLVMGATFSHLLGRLVHEGVGRGYAANTVAGALAPFVFGVFLVPRVGYGWAFTAVGASYGVLFAWLGLQRPARRFWLPVAGLVVLGWFSYSPQVLIRTPPGYRLVAQSHGVHGTVSVSERPFSTDGVNSVPVRLLQVNQNFLMGGALGYLEKRMGHIALLMAGQPRDVLFLGVGTGITAGTALSYRATQRVDAVELVPEVLDALDWFMDHNQDLRNDPRVTLHASDARRFLRATDRSFDLIVGELFHPTVNGAGGLFTLEHFTEARRHLRPGGLFVQWLPLYQLSPRELATIVRTFLAVFPSAHSVLGSYGAEAAVGLFAWAEDGANGIDMTSVSRALERPRGPIEVVRDPEELLAAYVTDAAGLADYAGAGALNTDLTQRVLFDAPSSLDGDSLAASFRSLEALLPHRKPFPDGLLRDRSALPDWRRKADPTARAIGLFVSADIERAQASPGVVPESALAGYLDAYEADVRLGASAQMLLELAGRFPDRAPAIVGEMARRNPTDDRVIRLSQRLAASVDATAALQALRDHVAGR